jgi:hypothetical protein
MTVDGLERDHLECRLNEEEREWVHTASKYVDTRHLPMMGKILKMFDDTSTLIGRWILLALIFGGMTGVLWYFGTKLYGVVK